MIEWEGRPVRPDYSQSINRNNNNLTDRTILACLIFLVTDMPLFCCCHHQNYAMPTVAIIGLGLLKIERDLVPIFTEKMNN